MHYSGGLLLIILPASPVLFTAGVDVERQALGCNVLPFWAELRAFIVLHLSDVRPSRVCMMLLK